MNYLNYKKQFPKSINLFFEWVSKQNPDNYTLKYYVDNDYFYHFFSEYFESYRREQLSTLFINTNEEYFQQLKSELVSLSLDENFCRFFENNRISFDTNRYSNNEYIRILTDSESSFESAFFVFEILTKNGFYVRK